MALSKGLAVGLTAVVVIVGGVIILSTVDIFGNTTTTLDLAMSGSECVITTPLNDKDVTVKKNKKITWKVHNACNSDQYVSVGNFRATTGDPGNNTTCRAGMVEPFWPFKTQDQGHRSAFVPRDGSEEIVLKEAKNTTGKQMTYYFDVCVAATKKDPRVVIEP